MSKDKYLSHRSEVLPFIPSKAGRILEVGCGRGLFGAQLKQRTPTLSLWGLELDPKAALEAKAHFDNVIIGDISEILKSDHLQSQRFDVIVCNDVLEHTVNPEEILQALKKHLSPGGVLVASIPNVRHFRVLKDLIFKKEWTYTDEGVLDKTHLRFFTSLSQQRLFRDAGFEIIEHKGINASRSMRPRIYSFLTMGLMSDTKFLQFVTVAKPKAS